MKQLDEIKEKMRGMTTREVASEGLLRATRQITRAYRRAIDSPHKTYITDAQLERSLGRESLSVVAKRIRTRNESNLTQGLGDLAATTDAIKRLFPDSIEAARREADAILAHNIKVFDEVYELGPRIDWHADPATGEQWNFDHYTRVALKQKRGSDVRAVWELNRLHHFTSLGRAYALTGDERYTEEFLIQFASWYEENPPRYGINWTVAMEAAIRAVNLIAALELMRASPLVSDDAIALILKTLLAHGRFIRSNLEFSHRTSSNHYLSDLIGLFAIGMTMPDLNDSTAWVRFSAPRLLEEMEAQVLADGVDYEGSTGYHRLVLEIFILFFSLSSANRIALPGQHWRRLERMFDFVRHYLKPDGTAPLIGDSDDGRLIRFLPRPSVDHYYLMPMAAMLLENETFKQSSRIDEEALWWYGEAGLEVFEGLPFNEAEPESRAFTEAQIFIQRQGPLYAIIDCGDHGARGRGSHAHSDALSLELYAHGQTLLRDPGTFVYTASERWRNLFRSTAYHNTVRVDGQEISLIEESQLFTLGPNVEPIINQWESTPIRDVLDAEHHAYERLAGPVVHRRVITFEKKDGFWILEDLFSGAGQHVFEFFFNFDAGLEAVTGEDKRTIARGKHSGLAIVPVSRHECEVRAVKRWVSLSYGTREMSSGMIYRFLAEVPFENMMVIIPFKADDEPRVQRILDDRGWGQSLEKPLPQPQVEPPVVSE